MHKFRMLWKNITTGSVRRFSQRSYMNGNVKKSELFEYEEEVLSALNSGKPTVALESTIITHGMPYPHNLEIALELENIVREKGAVPATISIIRGKIQVGTSQQNLERLANGDKRSTLKCSRRDFSYILSRKLNGGTTVSGTMLVAHKAGVPILATGGIGGVHRGAESTFDISADLSEFARTPVTVVCAGIKAILDIPKTLEYLETLGVPVISLTDSDRFPAFWSAETFDRIKSPMRLSSTKEAADLILMQRELGENTGTVLAVPIPAEFAFDPNEIESVIQKALLEAERAKIFGKNVTPFLLEKVMNFTEGRSLVANKALIINNASIAADIAVRMARNFASNFQVGRIDVNESIKHPVSASSN